MTMWKSARSQPVARGDVVTLPAPYSRGFAALVAAVATFALVLQYVLLIRATLGTVGPAFATVRFFTYFTILSNLLVDRWRGRARQPVVAAT